MKQLLTYSIFLVCLSFTTVSLAQNYQTNFSIQLGGQALYANPTPINFAIDSLFNTLQSNRQDLDPVKWAFGYSAGVGYHKGRANVRLMGSAYGVTSTALYTQSGEAFRRDLDYSVFEASLTLTSELIPITDIFGFYVGGGLAASNFRTASTALPESEFSESTELEEVSNEWKVGFIVQTPFRFGIGPQVKVSLEPFYEVFFSPISSAALAESLLGQPGPADKLRGDADHVGFTGTVIVYLRRN